MLMTWLLGMTACGAMTGKRMKRLSVLPRLWRQATMPALPAATLILKKE